MPNVLNHTDFIGIYGNTLSEEECSLVIQEFDNFKGSNPETILDSSVQYGSELKRKDFVINADVISSDIHNLISDRLHECLLLYCDHYFVAKNIQAHSVEVKLQRTPPKGGYHIWHCEQDVRAYADRVLVWTIYLNDIPYNEGETEFLWQGIRVNPKAGRCAIWPAAFTHTHRGNPVYTHDKYIATGWYTLI